MTNEQIIADIAIALYGEDAVEKIYITKIKPEIHKYVSQVF